MFYLLIALFVATIAVQIPNVFGVRVFGSGGGGFYDALKIATFSLPFTFLATAMFSIFYGKGIQIYSYPMLAIHAYAASLICAFAIQFLFVKEFNFNNYDLVASFLIVSGLAVSIVGKW